MKNSDIDKIPDFNHDIRWKSYTDKPPRRVTSQQAELGPRPSTIQTALTDRLTGTAGTANGKERTVKSLTRANSNTITNTKKKAKTNKADSSTDGEDSEVSDIEMTCDKFGTPAGGQQDVSYINVRKVDKSKHIE